MQGGGEVEEVKLGYGEEIIFLQCFTINLGFPTRIPSLSFLFPFYRGRKQKEREENGLREENDLLRVPQPGSGRARTPDLGSSQSPTCPPRFLASAQLPKFCQFLNALRTGSSGAHTQFPQQTPLYTHTEKSSSEMLWLRVKVVDLINCLRCACVTLSK